MENFYRDAFPRPVAFEMSFRRETLLGNSIGKSGKTAPKACRIAIVAETFPAIAHTIWFFKRARVNRFELYLYVIVVFAPYVIFKIVNIFYRTRWDLCVGENSWHSFVNCIKWIHEKKEEKYLETQFVRCNF